MSVDARPVHEPPPLPEKAKPREGPPPDLEQAPYWAAASEGRLMVQRCVPHGHTQLYPRAHCTRCRGEVRWVDASGFATVYSFTVLRQHHSRSLRHLLPLVVALVDLDEGPRIMTNLVNVDPADVHVGMRVEVFFERVADDVALPLFTPAAE
ncbi:MAG: Zn-ribbon domain-containing OB-fold protein [Acidimicrobiia bacterium]